MSIQIQIRGGTTDEHSRFKGVLREITCDTDKNIIVVQDGQTLGGTPLAREDWNNVADETIKDRAGFIANGVVGVVFTTPLASLDGFLLCDGSAVSRETYARLFERLGTIFGIGDGATTFNIPDYRGCFLRGHGGNSLPIGIRQLDAAPNGDLTNFSMSHDYLKPGGTMYKNTGNAFTAFGGSAAGGQFQSGAARRDFTLSAASNSYGRDNTTEVRPINHAVNFFIKY